MTCSGCGRANRDDARFCDHCGRALESSTRDPRAYTPAHLVDRILTSRSALEGERKHVTILFADIEGSTELSRRMGPETWHRLLDRYFRILADGVHRYEGTLNQFTGDGIMALFGAPIAHEDHAQRACHAALDLKRALTLFSRERLERDGFRVPVRIGLNSGDVVVGKIGDDLRMDYTAQGQTVALAARVQQGARPGHARLTEHTARLVEGFFRVRDLGTSALRGFPEPIRVYALQSAGRLRTRLERSQARGLSRLCGRTEELAVLEGALARAAAGEGQVVGIIGDAGVGKSRLAFEWAARCRAEGLAVHEAHCPAHGRTLPLFAVSELLRSYAAIEHDDARATVRKKIERRLRALSPAFETALPLVHDALGVGDPEPVLAALSQETVRARWSAFLRRWVQSASAQAPMVLLLDDLHWIDPESDALLGELVEGLGWTRTLLVANFRPEYGASWLRGSYCRALHLGPLGTEDRRDLLRSLLGDDPSLVELGQRIDASAAGNPLFLEEIVRAAEGSGRIEGQRGAYRLGGAGQELEIPESVQSVLAARIDRLPEREKQLLRTAAVIGTRVDPALLERVSGLARRDATRALTVLAELEFLESSRGEYAFSHPLTQEVAYQSQLEAQRQNTHAEVARALEELHSERLGERAALIAHHWEASGAVRTAARWRQLAALRVSRIQLRRSREGS